MDFKGDYAVLLGLLVTMMSISTAIEVARPRTPLGSHFLGFVYLVLGKKRKE